MGSALIDRDLPIWLRPSSVFVIVVLLLAARFFVAANVGLVRDEAYYMLWSFWPGPGYLDHPPMIAWMVAAGRAVLGENELAVRLFPLLATGLTSLAVYRTGRLVFDAATAAIAVIWFNVTVAAGLLFIAAPDAPAVLFWSLSVWAVAEFVARRNANWWLLAGIFAGLGLLSKYTVAFLGVGLILYLISSRERRGWLKLWQLWAGGILAIFVFLPNLVWNAQHDWASIAFQGRRLDSFGLSFGFVSNLAEYVAGQVLASGVFLFVFAVIAAVLFARRSDLPGRHNLALPLLIASPIFIYFAFYCLRFRAEANWPLVAWPTLSLAGAWAMVHFRPKGGFAAATLALFRRAQVPLGIALTMLIYVQAIWQPWSIGQTIDRTRDMRGWPGFYADAAALGKANGATWITVLGGDYGLPAEIAAYAKFAGEDWPVWHLSEPKRYGFRPPFDEALAEQPALVVTPGKAAVVGRFFDEVRPLGTVERKQRDEVLEKVNVFLAKGLKDR